MNAGDLVVGEEEGTSECKSVGLPVGSDVIAGLLSEEQTT